MTQESKFIFRAMFALLGWLCLTNGALGETLPEGKGKAEFVHICTACHGTDLVTRVRKTPAEWRADVDDMVDRGADGSKEEIDNVVLYLITNFRSDKAGPAAPAPSAAPSSASAAQPR
jgi:mono/diheme cytochrome c family protein